MKKRIFLTILVAILSCSSIFAQEMPQWISDYWNAYNNNEHSKADEIFNAHFDRNNSDCCYLNALRQKDNRNYEWSIGWLEAAIETHSSKSYYWKSTIYIKLAELYNQIEKYDEALDCLIKAKDDNFKYNNRGDWQDDIVRIADQYELMEQYAKAENTYYRILRYDSDNVDAKLGLFYLYMKYAPQEDSVLLDSVAYGLVNEVLTKQASNARAYYARAQYNQYVKQDYKAAISDYLAFMYYDEDYSSLDKFYTCARYEFQYAITAINQWVKYCNTKTEKREKNKYFFIRKRAKVYENNAYYSEAIEDYTEVLEDDPEGTNKLWALPSRGDCYSYLYDYQKAIDDYTRYIELAEEFDGWAYIQRACAYTEIGEYDKAINDWTTVIKNSEYENRIGYAYYKRGLIKEFKKDDYGALRDYNKGIEADSTYAYTYLMRGETYMRLNNPEKAKLDFEKVIEIDTIVMDGSCRQYALFFLGDSEGAISWMKQIIDAEPDNNGHYYDMACLCARMGRLQDAIDAIKRAFEMGYRRMKHIEMDDDLDPIRDMPEFKALLEKYEKETTYQQIEESFRRSVGNDRDEVILEWMEIQ
jgi:tetratricopeptide (TPR) repeat protein